MSDIIVCRNIICIPSYYYVLLPIIYHYSVVGFLSSIIWPNLRFLLNAIKRSREKSSPKKIYERKTVNLFFKWLIFEVVHVRTHNNNNYCCVYIEGTYLLYFIMLNLQLLNLFNKHHGELRITIVTVCQLN